jgi:hypothetical protein
VGQSDNPEIQLAKGAALIGEQLREYVLWDIVKTSKNGELWWRYMAKFDHNICLESSDAEDCSYSTMKELGLSDKQIKQVKEGVEKELAKVSDKEPNILRESFQESRELGIYFYPEVTINDRNFYGLFKAPEVFEAICDSLIDPPSRCLSFIR